MTSLAPLRRALGAAALTAAGFALAACAGAPSPNATVVHSNLVETNYSPQEVWAVGPAMPVDVRGTPPDGATAQEVAAALRLPAWFGSKPMELTAPDAAGPRVVVAFGGAPLSRICKGDPAPEGASPSARPLTAALAYCWGDRLASRAILTSPLTSGPRDAAFASQMLQGMRVLLPVRNPALDRDSRPGRFIPG